MTTETSPLLAAALDYARRGFSVIPLKPRDKRPALQSWKDYQSRCATEEEIRAWWQRIPNANVGIVTGAISKIVVLDIDGQDGERSLLDCMPELQQVHTPAVCTGKGAHLYFLHPGGVVPNRAGMAPNLDLRGDGGFVVAPPSIHPNGGTYAFVNGFDLNNAPAEAPPKLLSLIQGHGASKPSGQVRDFSKPPAARADRTPVERYVTEAIDRELGRVNAADEGTRNDTLNRASFSLGQLVGAGAVEREYVEQRLLMAATRAGLPEMEARRTIESGITVGIAQPRDLSAVGTRNEGAAVTFSSKFTTAPAEADPRGTKVIDISQYRLDRLTTGEPPERQWLTRGGLQLGVPVAVFGPGGVGKSMAVLHLGLKVATRPASGPISDPQTFLGAVPIEAAGAAIFVTLEDDTAEIHRRINSIDPTRSRDGWPFYIVPGLDIPGFDPTMIRQEGKTAALKWFGTAGLDALIETVAKDAGVRVRLVVLDPAGDFLDGSEDDAAVVKPLMRRLREIAARHGCTIILVGHTAKGQIDGNNVSERGMRGSGAWTNNARFGFGLWRPDNESAASILKRLELPVIDSNLERVVFGRVTKSNAPHCLTGIRKYLQDPKSGLLLDVTSGLRDKAKDEAAIALSLLVEAVREAATLRLPYQIDGKASLYQRRSELPEPLKGYGQKKLRQIGNAALESNMIQKCRAVGSTAPCWLDVPGGPYATGREDHVGTGSLAEARKALRKSVA